MASDRTIWSGLPENPEMDGWHLLWFIDRSDPDSTPDILRWHAANQWFTYGRYAKWMPHEIAREWEYRGPLYVHADLAARIQAEREATALSVRVAARKSCDGHADTLAASGIGASAIAVARTCAVIVDSLPIPTDALAAAIAEAEARGMERAAKLIGPTGPRPCDCKSCDCGNSGDAQYVAEWDAQYQAAAAIRAAKDQPA